MKKTIMIIDDEEFIRQSFADWFEDHQWIPLEFESAESALEKIGAESPDCAIVDIRMAGMNGDDFVREANRMRPDMAFVICTGSPAYDLPADLLAFPNVSGKVFTKPVTLFTELENTLLGLMDKIQNK